MTRDQALATSPEYFHTYINQVPDGKVLDLLDQQLTGFHTFFLGLPENKWGHRYAEGKWTVKEVVGHMIDCERIFGYRALRIARGDATAMPGFEENDYVANANFNDRDPMKLLEEFDLLRRANVVLLRSLPESAFALSGTASGKSFSVGGTSWIMVGHVEHHVKVLHERYL